MGRHLHEVRCCEGGLSVVAFLAAPEQAQSTSRGLQLFVGRRAIRDRGLFAAVLAGYGEHLASGRYPVAVVFIELRVFERCQEVNESAISSRIRT